MPVVQKGRGATNYAQRGMGIKLKEGSGSSITLINLIVRNATGTWEASPGYAYKKVTAEVPSPNYVETISGTLGYPWGNYSLRDELAPKIMSKDIDFYITFSYNEVTYTAFPNRGNISAVTHVCSAYSLSATMVRVSSLRYSPNGTLQSGQVIPELSESNGIWSGNGINLESSMPCTLTIIHHPSSVTDNN